MKGFVKILSVLLIVIFMTSCKSSKKCGCPTFGSIDQTHPQELCHTGIQKVDIL
ncbi:MAG: hypothetical protein M9887_02105 [Chitinophagales bacterium]|nr:hypothetical protein [Chitinophagales bacterium]